MEIRHLRARDADLVMRAGGLFDRTPLPGWTLDFLARPGNYLLVAFVEDRPVGFVTGIEILHPDKGPEVLLYELGVDEEFRGRGIGSTLVKRLRDLARNAGCRGMWVVTEAANEAATRVYEAAGAGGGDTSFVMEWVFDRGAETR